jgi:imidazolonepropionase-like amidohydrolase
VAGFQNSHVHFIGPQFEGAATRAPAELDDELQRMLTGYGFTTVLDTGSDLDNTLALRKRVESGELDGPRILTAGIPIFPENGIPFYLRDRPPDFLQKLSQPATIEAAVAAVRANLDGGADVTKLFVATPQGNRKVAYMSREIARAAVNETHARGRLVIAHPTDNQGVQIAIDAGVDILAHATLEYGPSIWPPAQTSAVVARGMALIPTLELYPYELAKAQLDPRIIEQALGDAVEQVRGVAAAGGQVLFGTDVGYMANYDPTDEYVYLARALTPDQILASLTIAPASRWHESQGRGRIEPGMDADVVVLDGDPFEDVRHYADVRCTIRQGRVIYRRSRL